MESLFNLAETIGFINEANMCAFTVNTDKLKGGSDMKSRLELIVISMMAFSVLFLGINFVFADGIVGCCGTEYCELKSEISCNGRGACLNKHVHIWQNGEEIEIQVENCCESLDCGPGEAR